MNEATEQHDEVVVVGYGIQKKSDLTGAISQVSSKDLEKQPSSSLDAALQGRAAGLQVVSSGAPGSNVSMKIRGIGSINASNNPLYVLDGVPYDGDMSAINPADIESISVLKDASASALYGARGANGVVMITTKKGAEGNANVYLKATWGFTSRAYKPYKTVNQKQYMELAYEATKNTFDDLTEEQARIEALEDRKSVV